MSAVSGPCALNIGTSFHATSPTSYTVESFAGPATHDSGGFWDAGQPTRATAPTNGWYLMYCIAGGDAGVGYRARFKVNGSVVGSTPVGESADGNVNTENMHMQFLYAGDYVEMEWLATNASRAATIVFEVTRLPTPLFVGHCANGDTGFLTWVKETGCKNDPRLWWDSGHPSRVTVDTTGTYLVMSVCTSGSDLWVRLYKNHSTVLHQGHNQVNSLNGNIPGGTTMVSLHSLTAGDYLELNSDGGVQPSWFAVALIDPLTNMVQATASTGTTEPSFGSQPMLTNFDTETIDTDGFHGGTTTRITVPSGMDGDYWVFGNDSIQSGNLIHFRKNGSAVAYTERNGSPNIPANDDRWTHGHVSWFDSLVAGDYFELAINTRPGNVTDPLGSFLGMVKLDSSAAPWPYESCWLPQIYRRRGGGR